MTKNQANNKTAVPGSDGSQAGQSTQWPTPSQGGTVSFGTIIEAAATRRPIRPKSMIMTIFGDSVVPRGGVVWLGSIVAMTGLFGLAEPLVRTSALRLTHDGWLQRRQIGKHSYYSMTDEFAAADIAYQSRIYSSGAELRQNGWTILKIFKSKMDRKTAYRLRQELDSNGFGQLAPQVFIHPSIADSAARHIVTAGGARSAVGPVFFADSASIDLPAMRHMVETSWDLSPVRAAYVDFIAAFDQLPDLLARSAPTIQEAFALRTLMMHFYRRVALRDPRLPASSFDDDWPGERAYRLMGEVYRQLLPGSEAYLEQTLETQPGKSIASDKRMHRRFGFI